MPKGLIRRGAAYSIRKIVPKELKALYGKREIVKALGTNDLRQAKLLYAEKLVEFEREFASKREELTHGPAEGNKTTSLEQFSPKKYALEFSGEVRAKLHIAKENNELLDEWKFYSDWIKVISKCISGEHDTQLTMDQMFVQRAVLRDIINGEGSASLTSISMSPLEGGNDLSSLKNALIDWRKNGSRTDKTYGRYALSVDRFIDHCERTKQKLITKQTGRTFIEELLNNGQTNQNINIIMADVRTIINHGIKQDIMDDNKLTGLALPDTRRKKEKRRPFNEVELAKLFNGPVHVEKERPSAGGGEAAFWIPLIALYTGGRLTEIGQLYVDDIREEQYLDDGELKSAWIVQFVENHSRGQRVKTEGSERRVPIHRDLIDFGFLQYVESIIRNGNNNLFPDIRPTSRKDLMGNWSKWFARYRRTLGINGKDTPFHSFRHNFNHYAKALGIPKDVRQALSGHETGDVSDNYGSASYPILPLVKWMEVYRVPIKLGPFA